MISRFVKKKNLLLIVISLVAVFCPALFLTFITFELMLNGFSSLKEIYVGTEVIRSLRGYDLALE